LSFIPQASIPKLFGFFVEPIVQGHYCEAKVIRGSLCRPVVTEFFDDMGNVNDFVLFLKAHNPHVDADLLRSQFAVPGGSGLKIPDIITHEDPTFEFYEIKPNNTNGIADGRAKLFALKALCTNEHLPYQAGTVYRPFLPVKFRIRTSVIVGTPYDVFLRILSPEPGLITYEVCLESGGEQLAVLTIRTLLALAIVATVATKSPAAATAAILLARAL
jgi:hypothetical protein